MQVISNCLDTFQFDHNGNSYVDCLTSALVFQLLYQNKNLLEMSIE